MLVTINGVNQFSTYTWQDVLNLGTWQEVLPYIWYDIYVESNNILMDSPTPEVDLSVDKRSTASFTILDIGALKHFKKGQEVEIYSTVGYKVFGGYIDSSSERLISGRDVIKRSISCADYHYLAEKRIVAKAWQDTTVETIVNYVLDQYLEAEGVTLGEIQAGGTVTQYIANYINAAKVLDNMAERAGFIWFIDEYKRLYFVDRTSYAAEWDLIETDDFLIEDALAGVSVTHANPEYTYVKTTNRWLEFEGFRAIDPSLALDGGRYLNSWLTQDGYIGSQRLHVEFTSARIVKRIRYCNSHHGGYETNVGVKDFIIQGTNNAAAFANLTYADDTNWTTIATDVSTMVQHTEGYDGAIWRIIELTNDVAYKYYAVNYPALKGVACS